MDVRDSFQPPLNVVDGAGFSWCQWSRGNSCFVEHLLLSGFGPVRVSRIEETTRGVSDGGFF